MLELVRSQDGIGSRKRKPLVQVHGGAATASLGAPSRVLCFTSHVSLHGSEVLSLPAQNWHKGATP